MKNYFALFLLGTFLYVSCGSNKNQDKKMTNNPLEFGFNQVIDFKSLTATNVKEITTQTIAGVKQNLAKIYDIPKEKRTFDNTMLAIDDAINVFSNVSNIVYLMAYTHSDSAMRNRSQEAISEFSKFSNELSIDEKLYRAVKDFSETEEGKKLDGYKKRFTEKTVRDFERSGFALSAEKRQELKTIKDKLADISIKFNANISDDKDSLVVEEKDMEGLPEDYKKAHLGKDGKYIIDMSYPSYRPFMRYSTSDKARKALYIKFNNRAAKTNADLLKELLVQRKKMAELLGYKTFAEYQVEDRMAKTPKAVWDFEESLTKNISKKADKDYAELLEMKRKFTKNPAEKEITAWESSFYYFMLMKEKYQVDAEKVKEYFELNNVLKGSFQVAETLFGVKFEEIKNPSVWHSDVRMFEVKKDGKLSGRFYLDLYPRENKYGHAACFGMVGGKATSNGYQIPTAALVCNFPKPTQETPSLMPHDDAITYFHEFGHLLHHLLTTAELNTMSCTNVANDYVETPSQLMENWAEEYESLKLYAKHYKTNEVLPKDLFDKINASKNVCSGTDALVQVFYGELDMYLHDKFDVSGKESISDVVKKLQNQISKFKFVEGTSFEASFGHLDGYGAGYYGYMWSLVYAEDVFSIFVKNGIFDSQTGIRCRDEIYAKGSTVDEMQQIKNFLQREPNQDAFLKSLGL